MASNSLGNAYVKIRGDIGDLRSDLDKALATIKNMESKVVDSNKKIQNAFDQVDKSIKNIVISVLSFEAAKKAFDVGKELVEAGLAAEKLSTAMQSATGSYNAAQSAMSFLRSEAARLGTDLASSTDGFIKLTASARGTALEGEKTREIFTAVSTAATALKLSNDEASGAIMAISQMMSKGTVQAEELRGQLGERLPGAFNLAAKAMGVSTAELGKMLEKGQVLASDFLPKLARVLTDEYGAAASKSADTTQAAVNRMNNSWEELKKTLGEDLLPTVVRVVEKLNGLIQMLTPDKFTELARVTQLQEKVANLQDRMTQPGMKWVLGDEFERAQKELKTLTYSMAGVTEQTGQWAKGMRDLAKDENNLLYPAKEGWQNFKEGLEKAAKTSAYDQIKDKTLDVTKQTEKLTEQLKNSTTYQDILAAKGLDAAEAWVKAAVKSETHHEKASTSMKDAKKSAEEYTRAVQEVSDKYNQLAMSADEYAKLKVWEWYEKEAAILGQNNEALQAARDLALQKIALDGEQAQAIKEITNEYNKLILSAKDYEMLELQAWFKKETEAIKDEKDALEKLNAVYASRRAKILYGDEKDTWVDFYKGKTEADERANELINKQEKETADGVSKIWDKAWKNIESDFADTIYDMMDKGIDSFGDFFDKLGDMFKKLLAEMVAAWLVSGLKTMLSGGEGAFSLAGLFGGSGSGSSGVSATGAASSAITLASLLKGISSLPGSIASGLTSLGEAIGLISSSTGVSVAGFEALESSLAAAAASTGAMATAAETSAAAFEGLESSMASSSGTGLAGALEGGIIAGIISIGANILPGLLGGGKDNIDIMAELKKWEAGYTNITKETADYYKTTLLNIDKRLTYIDGAGFTKFDWNKIDKWIADNQEFLKLTSSDIEKLIAQQSEVYNVMSDSYGFSAGSANPNNVEMYQKALIDVAIEIADDATLPVSQKMYQLGFVADKSAGGWSSDAVMSMIAEFKNQGVAWEDINNAMIAYGATDADVYKRIYAEYHGDSILTDLESLTAALNAEGISEDVLKTIKYIYSANIPLDQMQALLEWAGLSSEEAARIVGQIDPSDEWKDLVIPVDAPDSIPVDYTDMAGRASGGPVSKGTPYIVGEIGRELFIPQENGHILSHDNMKKLMSMGVQGFADGTVDPFTLAGPTTGTENPAGDAGGSSTDTSTYESISDWLDDYNEKLKEWLGTGNDLSDQLDDLNKFYEEQTGYANELQASQEQLDQLTKDQQKAKENILQDWLNDEISYYNEAMGLNTELGDSLADISEHYKTAIEEATSAGATEEQLGEIRKAQSEVTTKALQDWLAGEVDYYNGMMGLNTELGGTLDDISEHYKNTIAEAQTAGATEEQLAEIRKAQTEVSTKALQDWLDGETDYYNEMMGNTTALGKTLDDVNNHYADTIASAKAAGATEEQLAEIRKAQSEISQKAIQDEYDAFVEYYNGMMGIGSDLGNQIDEVKQKFEEYKQTLQSINPNADLSGLDQALQNIIDKLSADYWDDYQSQVDEFTGTTNKWMDSVKEINDFFKKAYESADGNADLQKKILSDWSKSIDAFAASLLSDYQSQVNEWMGIAETSQEKLQREIDTYFLMIYYFLKAAGAQQDVLDKIVSDYEAVTAKNKSGQIGTTTGSSGTTSTNDNTVDVKSIITSLRDGFNSLRDIVDQIDLETEFERIFTPLKKWRERNGVGTKDLMDVSGFSNAEKLQEYAELATSKLSDWLNTLLTVNDDLKTLRDSAMASFDKDASISELIKKQAASFGAAQKSIANKSNDYIEKVNGFVEATVKMVDAIKNAYDSFMSFADDAMAKRDDMAIAWRQSYTFDGKTVKEKSYDEQLAYMNKLIYYGDDQIQGYKNGYNDLKNLSVEEQLKALPKIEGLVQQRYELEQNHINALIDLVDTIGDKIKALKYSAYNVSLPTQKAAESQKDYQKLFAAAKTGKDVDAMNEYLNFIDTYLTQQQGKYKSSKTYQGVYDQVIKDMESIQGSKSELLLEKVSSDLAMRGTLVGLADYAKDQAELLKKLIVVGEGGQSELIKSIMGMQKGFDIKITEATATINTFQTSVEAKLSGMTSTASESLNALQKIEEATTDTVDILNSFKTEATQIGYSATSQAEQSKDIKSMVALLTELLAATKDGKQIYIEGKPIRKIADQVTTDKYNRGQMSRMVY